MALPLPSPSSPLPSPKEPLTITIQTFADTACPWSYIAKVVLDHAMKTFQARHGLDKVRFELSWNPFYLWPEMKASCEFPSKVFTLGHFSCLLLSFSSFSLLFLPRELLPLSLQSTQPKKTNLLPTPLYTQPTRNKRCSPKCTAPMRPPSQHA